MEKRTVAIVVMVLIAVTISSFVLVLFSPASVDQAKSMPHSVEGYENCLSCHQVDIGGVGDDGGTSMPDNHKGYISKTCMTCHKSMSG